ncbi:type I restriction enzyme M protein [Mucilaginibacter sp. OK268]|uniref:type I restriction enzyme HsdR N-terminal domain-containing protein n=1 Tax=Mucilaginibacter sp. OK268 TaxID=1881048 RepID=UPI000884E50B|nr:N-6 DNA methylase [Mucilaginibacter sp. OK268]SDQ01219.1 type I restriction enzyme M protein [Mucilaginibacter sp. OK268]
MTVLQKILKDSNYKLTQFTENHIQQLEQSIVLKDDKKGNKIPYAICSVRQREIKLTPEEVVRQLFLILLHAEYGYAYERMELEYAVTFGREKKRADIVVFGKVDSRAVYIMVEIKKPKLKDGKEQLHSYCNATGAPIGVWSNGESISYYHRKDPNYFEYIPAIPKATQKLADLLNEPWTLDDLKQNDRLVTEKKSLKDLVLEMEDEVLANAGVDVFEELFKLIFTKLYDEMESGRNRKRYLEFRNHGDTEVELKDKIQQLFNLANTKWQGVFPDGTKLILSPSHLAICISSLEKVKLFNSNLDVVDEAFEYLINKSSKGEKGQYFTPRYGIDMCVKMLNPKESETMIDTAAGSCGFPVHTFFYVKNQIHKEEGITDDDMMTTKPPIPRVLDYVQNNVFAIDFDEKAVRVARCLNLIAGDGQTNVLHLNTLDYERWTEKTKDEDWLDTYANGWKNLRKHRKIKTETKENESYVNRDFQFDILMANPPFAGDIKESRMLAKYELGKKPNGKYQTAVGRDILFIERNLDFLKPGGRLAIVLPQGRFNNSSDKGVREFISEHCRILGVVGFHGNFFKPHTGTKTSVLLAQKWNDDPDAGPLCPRKDDYPIFFGTMQEPSKDNSGEKIYVRKKDYPQKAKITEGVQESAEPLNIYDENPTDLNEYLLDRHGHLMVKHDLYNHDGLTKDGIAEAFIEFAKKEQLSFF